MKYAALCIALLFAGCWQGLTLPEADAVALPHATEFRQGNLVIHNDADVSEKHPLFAELAVFPEQVCRELQLPISDKLIHIYLFKDRSSFERYLHREFKDIPSRRALFVKRPVSGLGKSDELQILCFWGDQVQIDLRHELTHATLHSLLHDVPLWLDEGLAMYFEPGIAAQGRNQRALAGIENSIQDGTWKCDLPRLQGLTEISQMGLQDYYEVWAWTYYLLNATPLQRSATLVYLKERMKPGAAQMPWTISAEELQTHLKTLLGS
jgi:hypothetical protein